SPSWRQSGHSRRRFVRFCAAETHQDRQSPSQDHFQWEVAAKPEKMASCSPPFGGPPSNAPTGRFHTAKTLSRLPDWSWEFGTSIFGYICVNEPGGNVRNLLRALIVACVVPVIAWG